MAISVLVVDDHPLYREGVVAALSRPQSDTEVVGEASAAAGALALALRLRPTVVLTDLRLPCEDGIWLTREVRNRLPETRVVIVTGLDAPAAVAQALDAGASGVLTKDASVAQIRAAIQAVAAGGEFVSAQVARLLTVAATRADDPSDPARPLSLREREVLARLAAGQSNRRIADGLVVSVRTVDNHVRNIYSKLGIHDRAQAALLAARMGLVTEPSLQLPSRPARS